MTIRTRKTKAMMRIPTIDLSMERSELSEVVVKACEEYGIFKVVNHSVPKEVIRRLEEEGAEFFAKPTSEKCQAGPPTPFGYGFKNIGSSGDMGDLEYLLLRTNPISISEASKTISNHPTKFSGVVNDYIEAAKVVACEILDLVADSTSVETGPNEENDEAKEDHVDGPAKVEPKIPRNRKKPNWMKDYIV